VNVTRASSMKVGVVLVDDQPLIRAGLRVLVDDTPDLSVLGEAGNGADAVRIVAELRPDVVVMDVRMPGMDGIEATSLILGGDSATRVIILTTFDDDDYVFAALRAGASGFLLKDIALDDVLTAIRVVAAGDALIAPSVTRRLIGCGQAATEHHRARTRGAHAGRPWTVEQRDRSSAVHQRGDGKGAPRAAAGQARCP
jgi:DNA-binding NarL/FixJ family response regulator